MGTIMTNDAASAARKLIEDARQLLQPKEVRLHKAPPWLNKRLAAYRKAQGWERLPTSMLVDDTIHRICDGPGGWLDHWGMLSETGPFACCQAGPVFVSEPYGFDSARAKSLDRFCKALGGGLTWHVSSNTWWYPGHTVRIVIHPEEAK